jgi:hypothetical protein
VEKITTSDINPAMAASRTFDSILEKIQRSNLNFQLQISPFSAVISLKKSLVKDKSGNTLLPPSPPPTVASPGYPCTPPLASEEVAALIAKNLKLEKDVLSIRKDYEDAIDDAASAHFTIKQLQSQPKLENETLHDVKKERFEKNFQVEISCLIKENEGLKRHIEDQAVEINDLEVSKKKGRHVADKLNKELANIKTKFKKEKAVLHKQHKAEVKAWRKDLGDEIKLNIKLDEKLSESKKHHSDNVSSTVNSTPETKVAVSSSTPYSPLSPTMETLCSICAEVITNYTPRYFLDEKYNPACDSCQDSSFTSDDDYLEIPAGIILTTDPQHPITPKGFNHRPTRNRNIPTSSPCSHTRQCIIRQPFPPPLPCIMPLVNEYSLYHVKTMAGELDWGRTCSYCMRIDYEKYVCDSCVWIKCYGELHGFPDADPYDFKRYL